VREAFPTAVILRPSIVFGTEDKFFNRFASMARLSPAIPVIGGRTRFQPVWVKDVAEAACVAAEGGAEPGLYELGGPEIHTFRELMRLMLRVIRRRRAIVEIPFWAARIQGAVLQNLPGAPLTLDQVRLLVRDNVVSEGARGFEALGIEPAAPEGIVESYLYPYRPYGQYATLDDERDAEWDREDGRR
jgi:NADH dehydrogenase